MAWMIWLYSGYSLVLLAELWFLLRRDFAAGKNMPGIKGKAYRLLSLGFSDVSDASAAQDRKVVRVLATIGVPVAIMFSGGVGALFGVVAAHPHWHSGMFPILFLLSGLVGGGALLTLVSTIFQDGWHRNRDTVISLGKLILGLLLLEALFQASEFLIAFRGGVPGDVAGLKLVVGGPYWWVFWLWQVLLGTLAPALLLIFPTRRNPHWVSLAGLLIAAGLFGLRLNIVIPGLAVEEIQGLSDAIASARVSAHYLPSVSEWMLTGGIVGLGLLLFGLGEKWLPMEPKEFENVRV
jgi:molybdopterin-containing oxidoreductase family membrane subunit